MHGFRIQCKYKLARGIWHVFWSMAGDSLHGECSCWFWSYTATKFLQVRIRSNGMAPPPLHIKPTRVFFPSCSPCCGTSSCRAPAGYVCGWVCVEVFVCVCARCIYWTRAA
eukprot:jgi/Botrbrau1/698/Bobra.160_2s0021.1